MAPKNKPSWVTAAAALLLVIGGIADLVIGVLAVFNPSYLFTTINFGGTLGGQTGTGSAATLSGIFGQSAAYVWAASIAAIIIGLLYIVVAVGVYQKETWGRVGGIALSLGAIVFGLLAVFTIVGWVVVAFGIILAIALLETRDHFSNHPLKSPVR